MILTSVLAGLLSAASGAMSAREGRRAIENQRRELRDERTMSDADYYGDRYLNSVDGPVTQSELAGVRRQSERNNGLADQSEVSGQLTHDQALAAKQRVNDTMANAVDGVVSRGAAMQSHLNQSHWNRNQSLGAVERGYDAQVAQNWSNLGDNLGGALAGVVRAAGVAYADRHRKLNGGGGVGCGAGGGGRGGRDVGEVEGGGAGYGASGNVWGNAGYGKGGAE